MYSYKQKPANGMQIIVILKESPGVLKHGIFLGPKNWLNPHIGSIIAYNNPHLGRLYDIFNENISGWCPATEVAKKWCELNIGKPNLSGKKISIIIDGKTYTATIN